MTKTVSVVLGSFNRSPILKLTIESVRKELEDIDHEIIVVDGGSTDGALDWLIRQKDIITIVQHNRGEWNGKPLVRRSWGYFMNLGFKAAQGKYVCMISDDCLVVPSTIKNGIKRAEEEIAKGVNVGAVAFYYRDYPKYLRYRVQYTLGNSLFVNHGLYLTEALRSVGYVDEDSYQFYHADGDLSLRIRKAGYIIIESPDSFIEHLAHSNLAVRDSNNITQQNDWKTYLDAWKGVYYDPNLDDTGSIKEKDFFDPNHTIHRFREATVQNHVRNAIYLTGCIWNDLKAHKRTIAELAIIASAKTKHVINGKK